MQSRSRTVFLFISAAIILLFVCGGGMIFADNATENTLPGDTWFGVREFKETLGVSFARDSVVRAAQRMNIVALRLNDFAARAGTPYELVAFSSLDDAVDQALVAIADLSVGERAAPLYQLAVWMSGERDWLAKAGLSRDSAFLASFDEKMAAVQSAAGQGTAAPERLRAIAVLLPLPSMPVAADPSAMAVVAPRVVPPPPGFKHSYPLDGAHAKIACGKCHSTDTYTGAPSDCAACHSDPHNNALGRQCSTCHTTTAWKPAKKN